jgi:hypothetical protein
MCVVLTKNDYYYIYVGFGPEEDFVRSEHLWVDAQEKMETRQSCVLRLHIYHCKAIRAGDSNGLSDPYVEVKFKGKKNKTATKYKTIFPQYFETMEFKGILHSSILYKYKINMICDIKLTIIIIIIIMVLL